jgi:hypothetical protein
MDLGQVGRELRLLVPAGGDVRVGRDDLAPGLQAGLGLPLDGSRGGLPHLALRILLMADAHKVFALALYLGRLGSGHGLEQPLGAVEGAIGVVCGEGLMVCPAIANVAQLAHERPLGLAQLALEHLLPVEPDGAEHDLGIGEGIAALPAALLPEIRDLGPLRPVHRGKLTLDKRLQPVTKLLDRLADSLLVGQRHG